MGSLGICIHESTFRQVHCCHCLPQSRGNGLFIPHLDPVLRHVGCTQGEMGAFLWDLHDERFGGREQVFSQGLSAKSSLVDLFRRAIERIDELDQTRPSRLGQLLVSSFKTTSGLEGYSTYLCSIRDFERRAVEKHLGLHTALSTKKEGRLW